MGKKGASELKLPAPIKRKGAKNPLELKYEQEFLAPLILQGGILKFYYESVTLVLADRTTYTPDFFVVYEDHFECHEIKGSKFQPNYEKSNIKWKVAAEQFPHFVFRMIFWNSKSKVWDIRTYGKATMSE